MMSKEIKPTTTVITYTTFTETKVQENMYPVRDKENKKLEASDLFSLFTADIIKKDVVFSGNNHQLSNVNP